MRKRHELPLSGYAIEKVYTTDQHFQYKEPGDEDVHSQVDIGWDWRLLLPAQEETRFEVRLSASVEPSTERTELISASIAGRFRLVDPSPTVPVADFVRLQAPAILLPYVRQVLSHLTMMSYYGTYYLPPINVVELMQDFDPANTTGARQLAEFAEALKPPRAHEQPRRERTSPSSPARRKKQPRSGQ